MSRRSQMPRTAKGKAIVLGVPAINDSVLLPRSSEAAFLAPGGALIDVCGGAACLTAPDVG